MTETDLISQISKILFWDVDFNKINLNDQMSFIIPRVMDRGSKKDVKLIWDYYGEEVIKENLMNTRYLENKTIYFFANLFSVEPDKFRSFQFKKLNSKNWNL